MHPATQLDQALRAAGLPIVGVSMPTDDRTTWHVQLDDHATPAQQAEADRLVASFVPSVVVDIPHEPLTAESVLAWCAGKFGVDVIEATLEVVSGLSVKG